MSRDAQLLAILDAGPIGPEALAGLSRQRRQAAEIGIAALIAALDAIEPDPDIEDGADDEPSLGSLGGCAGAGVADQRLWSCGGCGDIEEEDEHGGDLIDEPSLGAPEIHHDQRRWGQGHQGSRELDHDERADLSAFGWEQQQAVTRARHEAEAMVRRVRPAPPQAPDAANVIPFPLLRRAS